MSLLLKNLIASQMIFRKSFLTNQNLCKCHHLMTLNTFYQTDYQPTIQPVRLYAKGKNKIKEKGKKKVVINESQLEEVINISSLREKMDAAVEDLKLNFVKNLSLRSSSGSVESLKVEFEDEEYVLQDLAQISRKNPKTVLINMSSFPQIIPATLKALTESGMNVNPQQEGTTIIIPIPKVTKEHREILLKNSKALFTKCKDNIRDVQNKYTKMVKNKEKSDNLATDDIHSINEQLKLIADQYIEEAEKILNEKQAELKGETK